MDKEYYIVEGNTRVGPLTFSQLAERGLEPSTLVWTAGLSDWTRADCLPEIAPIISQHVRIDEQESAFGAYTQPSEHTARINPAPAGYDPYTGNSQIFQQISNWKTIAIVATVAGFIFSCIGGLIGAFGIAAASKAATAFRMGEEYSMRSGLQTCKTLTIISLVFSGIGLLVSIGVLTGRFNLGLTPGL